MPSSATQFKQGHILGLGNTYALGNKPNKTSFKKGFVPWNAGTKKSYYCSGCSEKVTDKRTRFCRKCFKGSNTPLWKDKVGYTGIHMWVKKAKGKLLKCEHCGVENRRMHWANKNHTYLRKLTDWISLCVPCHRKYDGVTKKSKI